MERGTNKMITVNKNDEGILIARAEIDLTNIAEVSAAEPEYLTIRSVFDNGIVTKMRAERFSLDKRVLHDRLLYFIKKSAK